ncbi:response regulator transcription factor [Clostridium fallax]|uniref:Stage 0 sporulation protein A homolog n=1 Tax=Clostridium fallax TaxID=1533 RepID=A0A1M4Y4M2_9CLOT|nr:response regulator [Clostridium fallax]SHF00764.1 two component transcriptional regulator, AraC family [Clostridium fallax]SQB07481.1 AraC family transcriptional regulator [Clostridium fallax]
MLKIMIVDDESLERQALKFILNKLMIDFTLMEACNGREALELNKEFNPDIIIMDVKMPGIDGIKASQIIKTEYPNKIIVMVTAYDDFELIRKALVLGVNDYILKPVKPEELLEVLNKIIVNLKINNNSFGIKKNNNEDFKGYEDLKSDSPVKLAIDYINDNLKENISLEKVASVCNLSPCYFSKLFKKEVGLNFISYVNNVKINKAKEILELTDTPILNLALDLGFEDCGYFIRVFKRLEGVTPKKYRETYIKNK